MEHARLLYRSTAAEHGVSPAELAAILAVSRANNRRDGLTGALIAAGGVIVQVLEGPAARVEATFERICRDPRHGDVQLLDWAPAHGRLFADWDMGAPPAGRCIAADDIGLVHAQEPSADELLGLLERQLRG